MPATPEPWRTGPGGDGERGGGAVARRRRASPTTTDRRDRPVAAGPGPEHGGTLHRVIVVIGSPLFLPGDRTIDPSAAAGLAVRIAAARRGVGHGPARRSRRRGSGRRGDPAGAGPGRDRPRGDAPRPARADAGDAAAGAGPDPETDEVVRPRRRRAVDGSAATPLSGRSARPSSTATTSSSPCATSTLVRVVVVAEPLDPTPRERRAGGGLRRSDRDRPTEPRPQIRGRPFPIRRRRPRRPTIVLEAPADDPDGDLRPDGRRVRGRARRRGRSPALALGDGRRGAAGWRAGRGRTAPVSASPTRARSAPDRRSGRCSRAVAPGRSRARRSGDGRSRPWSSPDVGRAPDRARAPRPPARGPPASGRGGRPIGSFGVVVRIVNVRRIVSVGRVAPAGPQAGQGERRPSRRRMKNGRRPRRRAATRRSRRPGRCSGGVRKLSAKVRLVATVSARALIRRAALRGSSGPERDEAPAVGRDRPPITALDDDRGRVGRSQVEVAAGIVDERLGVEQLGQLGRRALLGEAAAHRPDRILARVRAMDPTARRAAPDPHGAQLRRPTRGSPGRSTARPPWPSCRSATGSSSGVSSRPPAATTSG